MPVPEVPLPHLIEHLFRDHYGRIVSGLTRIFGPERLDLAEDVAQEALLRAMKVWPFEGVPDRPEAWLFRVARNLALDAVRHRAMARRVEEQLAEWAAAPASQDAPDEVADDRLRMIFTCCHPQLPPESRVALTLKTLGGLGVAEIAGALLQKEATIAQRLSRAKAHLQRQGIAFEVPGPHQLRPRLHSVLEVLYLMFNEGYRVHRGAELLRPDLVTEAIRLTGLLLEMPQTALPKVRALLALMLFLGSRLPARTDAGGEPLTLALQDRTLWDREWIGLAFHHFGRSIGDDDDEMSSYHAEAAIASCHAAAPTYADTDWPRILERYDHLLALDQSPIVRLNRAVALAKVRGADAALAELRALGEPPALRAYNLLPATKAQLLWVKGDHAAAAQCLRLALAIECSMPERAFLERRLAQCQAGEDAPVF